ncbi:uncharacterized protein LOC110026662 isoform X2 [Phalaenopsis equestris]|uniref:uncharacterized protein LOC110026662 isoform X2 n=1 Tax=Phalaenopsis equestris TaxID=78828 RepID=UPI0009E1C4EB|nr:uncharacterized protein LOC110026662 isoform X2 [Phalaenopsis equestris]
MAIVKNSFRASRMNGYFSSGTVSSEEDDEGSASMGSSTDGGSASDADSGMGSDEIDLSEFGESGMEFCQVGNQSCSIPLELYDLPDLGAVLSIETWNDCLTEEERFALAEYLPDMEYEGFALNMKELLGGMNFHFGNPVMNFFNRLKGGFFEPRIVLYRQGLNLFKRRQYYHWLRNHQDSMVRNLVQIRDIWVNCNGYGVEERLRVLNILKRKKSLGYDKNGYLGSEMNSESGDSSEAYWSKRFTMDPRARKSSQKVPSEVFSKDSRMNMKPVRFGKEKSKGILKVAVPKGCNNSKGSNFPLLFNNGTEKKAEMPRLSYGVRRKDNHSGFDAINGGGRGGADGYFDEQVDKYGGQGDWNAGSRLKMARSGLMKSKNKKHFREEDPEMLPDYLGGVRRSDQEVTIASYDYDSVRTVKKPKHSDKNLKYTASDELQHRLPKSKVSEGPAIIPHSKQHKVYDECVPLNNFDMKWNAGDNHRSGFGLKAKSFKVPPAMSETFFQPEYRTKNSQGKLMDKSSNQLGVRKGFSRARTSYVQSEETESDSSDELKEDGHGYPYTSRPEFPTPATEARQSGFVKPVLNYRKPSKAAKSNRRDLPLPLDGVVTGHTAEDEPNCKTVKQKGKTNYKSFLHGGKSARKHQAVHLSEELQPASLGSRSANRKRKLSADIHHSSQRANEIYNLGSSSFHKAEDNFDANTRLSNIQSQADGAVNKIQVFNEYALESGDILLKNIGREEDGGYHEDLNEPSYQQFNSRKQIDDSSATKRRGKRKADAIAAPSPLLLIPEPTLSEKVASELDIDMKTQRKSFTLITPTIHTGFSFSVIHLLSAVRKALVSPPMEDNAEIGNHLDKFKAEPKRLLHVGDDMLISHSQDQMADNNLEPGCHNSLPSVKIQDIVNHVRSNPGDPCILETQEPLQDLIRGVLRIFSSRTAPLGAKGWKALVSYEKSSKSWTWIGPLSSILSDNDNAEETSAETWGISHKMLVKLVDAFANWLKSGQETLQQIGSLPAPPPMLPVLDEKERFRDLRAQKSLNTIRTSSEEVRAYFRKEELLRYSIPDRAFQYTAFDGRKSIVAPLRRGGGKPTSKARDHFMLKPDRPPHVTVLCLVRDAASRLPGSVGTRADVCTLIRDSQYIVEDVTDAQINQVVSGALDRLHYERDPCVQFDGERKLWVYLHRDREDEDFEDDGTSSTKKWKRQRKDATDNSDVAAVNDSNYAATGDPTAVGSSGYDFHPDLNVGDNGELVYSDLRPTKENFQSFIHTSHHADRRQDNSMSWDVLGAENRMLCQENSTNEDFDDESFSRDRTAGFLGGSLL